MGLLISVADYEDAAIRYHHKFLQIQAFFNKSRKGRKPTKQQWQQQFAKDPNAMDLTPGRTRVRAALTDDEMNKLRQEGKCFKCKCQGHIGHNCPNQNSQIRATNTNNASSGTSQTPGPSATNTSTASSGASAPTIRKAITAQELVDLVRDMNQGEKDKVIQDIFMQGGFCRSSDLTAWGRAIRTLKCNSVYLTRYQSMKIPVSFRTLYARADKQILVDSGATDNFIDPRLIKRLGLRSLCLEQPRKIWNIDRTNNRAGMISDYLDLNVQSGNKNTKM
jgi:hypothetical protein